jgi:hypothetical protein
MSKNRATALNGHFTGTSEIGEAATFVGLAHQLPTHMGRQSQFQHQILRQRLAS